MMSAACSWRTETSQVCPTYLANLPEVPPKGCLSCPCPSSNHSRHQQLSCQHHGTPETREVHPLALSGMRTLFLLKLIEWSVGIKSIIIYLLQLESNVVHSPVSNQIDISTTLKPLISNHLLASSGVAQ